LRQDGPEEAQAQRVRGLLQEPRQVRVRDGRLGVLHSLHTAEAGMRAEDCATGQGKQARQGRQCRG